MADQPRISTGRQWLVDTTTAAAAPTNNSTLPLFRGSPEAGPGLTTTGMIFGLTPPGAGGATPTAGGFSLIWWIQNPATGNWFAMAAQLVDYREAFVSFDFDASALYLQIDAGTVAVNGNILLEAMEQ